MTSDEFDGTCERKSKDLILPKFFRFESCFIFALLMCEIRCSVLGSVALDGVYATRIESTLKPLNNRLFSDRRSLLVALPKSSGQYRLSISFPRNID